MKQLVLGGVKSGKSRYAERKARALVSENNCIERPILIASAQALDTEMAARIQRHQADRGEQWSLIEEPLALGKAIRALPENAVVVIDCLTLWLTNLLMLEDEAQFESERRDFLDALKDTGERSVQIILVSNESNMGITPLGELSRRYCDEIGLLHQEVAVLCDQVELVVAGLPLSLKSPS